MPRFVTIGYGNAEGYERTPASVRDAAHAHDETLKQRGVRMGMAGAPVTVRNPYASGIQISHGPYMSSALPVAGFAVFEAGSLDEAVQMVSKTPCAVAHGVVEVWPLQES